MRACGARKAVTISLSALGRYRRMNSTAQTMVMPAEIRMAGVKEWNRSNTTPIRMGEPMPPTLPTKLTKPLAKPTPLGPAISATHAVGGRLPVITFDPLMEQGLLEALRAGEAGSFLLVDPEYAERIALEAARLAEQAEQAGERPVLVCAQPLRLPLRRIVESAMPSLPVLSYSELGSQLSIHTLGAVNVAHAPAA